MQVYFLQHQKYMTFKKSFDDISKSVSFMIQIVEMLETFSVILIRLRFTITFIAVVLVIVRKMNRFRI